MVAASAPSFSPTSASTAAPGSRSTASFHAAREAGHLTGTSLLFVAAALILATAFACLYAMRSGRSGRTSPEAAARGKAPVAAAGGRTVASRHQVIDRNRPRAASEDEAEQGRPGRGARPSSPGRRTPGSPASCRALRRRRNGPSPRAVARGPSARCSPPASPRSPRRQHGNAIRTRRAARSPANSRS